METRKAGGVLLVVAALAGWQWKRAVVASEPLASMVAALENRKGEIRVVLEKEELFREESSALDRRLVELRRAIPAALDVERFEAELRGWAEGLGIEVSSWEVGEPRAFDFYRAQSVSATLEGPEQSLDELSSSRDALGRAIRWEETSRRNGELDLRLAVFSRIALPTEPPSTLCSRLDVAPPPAMLWPFGGRVTELRAERDRLCAFELDHTATSRAIEEFSVARDEEAMMQVLLHKLVGAPAPDWVVRTEGESEG